MKEQIAFLQNRIDNDGVWFLDESELRDIVKLRESFALDVVNLVEKILKYKIPSVKQREDTFTKHCPE